MAKSKPRTVGGLPLPKLGGLAGLLAESGTVANAFGKWPGFILMMMALMVFWMISLATIVVTTKGVSHFFG
jgi:hypothetical protein